MNAQTWVTIAVALAGAAGNLIWTLLNLRVRDQVRDIVQDLKDWMDEKYLDANLADERHKEVCRRLDVLEGKVVPISKQPPLHCA